MDSGHHRSDPAPTATSGEAAACRPALLGPLAYALHGLFFLALAAAALAWFGPVFDVVSGIVAVLALASLRQAWIGLRHPLAAGADGRKPRAMSPHR